MAQPINLTFGIELEFIAVFPRSAFNNREADLVPSEEETDDEITAGHALQYFLLKADINATGWEELGTVAPNAPSYSSWNIKTDCLDPSATEYEHIPTGYGFEPIEISSPILNFQDNWRDEIRRVLHVLAYMRETFGCNFLTNQSTGFHVHVGNNRHPMPFHLVKRMFQLATAHERAFDSLHASSRVLAPFEDTTDNSRMLYAPLSFFHRQCDESYSGLDVNNVFEWNRRIEMFRGFYDFHSVFHREFEGSPLTGHSSAVNFDNLYSEDGDEVSNTVEFRQHVGTLDYAEIVAWVVLLASFVRFCQTAHDVTFMSLVLRATDMNFTATDFMRAIGCPEQLVQHYDFDGEGGTIGMLPPPGQQALTQDRLELLTAQNDDEVTENSDYVRVKQLINHKISLQYYGFDSSKGALPLEEATLHEMLQLAGRTVSRQVFDDNGNGFLIQGSPSHARAKVYGALREMHNDMDPNLGSLQQAITRGIWSLSEPSR